MGIFSKFESRVEDTFEEAANRLGGSAISPVQIAKKAEKQMRRERMVGAGKQYAPTLYTVLVSFEDDDRLFGYYPTLAGETETYLAAKAAEQGLVMDGQPLVRFIPDEGLKRGKFEVIAEAVAAPIVAKLRQEELERYGLPDDYGYAASYADGHNHNRFAGFNAQDSYTDYGYDNRDDYADYAYADYDASAAAPAADGKSARKPPLPYVPEDEIDYSIDYGEYTFDSLNFEDYRNAPEPATPQTMVFPQADASPRTAATPRAPQRSMPAVMLVDTATNRTYALKKPHLTLGRETVNDIVISDINASRRHAEMTLDEDDVWTLEDAGSTNGTYINGREVGFSELRIGDRITIGTTTLLFTRA